MGFKEWCVGQITLPDNFKQILNSNPSTPDAGPPGSGVEVICLGLSRTGTSSLKAALSILQGRTFHAMDFLNQINDEESFKFWKSLADESATPEAISAYFARGNYRAVCDVPCITYWKDIVAAHPNAKIILTTRDPEQWYQSVRKAIFPIAHHMKRWAWLSRLVCYILYGKSFQVDLMQILFQPFYQKHFQEEPSAIQLYHAWNDDILATIPPTNLLVFDVRSGWGPLCQFVGCPQPETPFPRLNDASAFVKHQRYLIFLTALVLLVIFAPIMIILLILLYICL